jgi:hypothetical protein
VDSSKIKKKVMEYNDALDDYDAMGWGYCSENFCVARNVRWWCVIFFRLSSEMIVTEVLACAFGYFGLQMLMRFYTNS